VLSTTSHWPCTFVAHEEVPGGGCQPYTSPAALLELGSCPCQATAHNTLTAPCLTRALFLLLAGYVGAFPPRHQ
jgi:hypothetical protein